MAGLAAAWRLSEPGWTERFSSITVLERGFRLGGKGASSRGPHGRIEEHGLHVWLGHYDNAFRVMRDCYAELDRERTDPHCPIRTWRDAFFPAGELGLFDRARMAGCPGWRGSRATASCPATRAPTDDPPIAELLLRSAADPRLLRLARHRATRVPPVTMATSPSPPTAPPAGVAFDALASTLLAVTQQLLLLGSREPRRLAGPRGAAVIDAAFAPLLARLAPAVRTDLGARRLHDLVDLVRCVLRGMAADGLAETATPTTRSTTSSSVTGLPGAQPSTLQSALVRGSTISGSPTRTATRPARRLRPDGACSSRTSSGSTTEAPSSGRCAAGWAKPSSLRCTRRWSRAACGSGSSRRWRSSCRRLTGQPSGPLSAGRLVLPRASVNTGRWWRSRGSCFPSAPDLRQLGTGPSPCSTRSYAAVRTSTCSLCHPAGHGPARLPPTGRSAARLAGHARPDRHRGDARLPGLAEARRTGTWLATSRHHGECVREAVRHLGVNVPPDRPRGLG